MKVCNGLWQLPGRSRPEWIGRAPHEELERGPSRAARPRTRSTTPRPASNTPNPAPCCAPATSSWAFFGLIPQRVSATQLLYRITDMQRRSPGHRHHCAGPAERTARGRPARRVLPVRHRRGAVPLLPLLCDAPARQGASARWPSWNTCWSPLRWLKAGWCRSPTTRVPTACGAPLMNPVTACSTVCAPRSTSSDSDWRRTARSACGVTPAAGWPARGRPRCTPSTPPSSTSSAQYSAPRWATWATRSADSTAPHLAALPALVVTALAKTFPDLNRVIEEHATEEGRAVLTRLERMTTLEAIIRLFKHRHGQPGPPATRGGAGHAGGPARLRPDQAGRNRPDPAGTDRAGRARLGDRRRRYRRTGAHLPLRRRRR